MPRAPLGSREGGDHTSPLGPAGDLTAGASLSLSPETDQWGRGPACRSQCARACAQLWVALAFSAGFQRKEFLFSVKLLWKFITCLF
jgi:hypothetical protein